MAGGQYDIRQGLSLCFGIIGGKYIASVNRRKSAKE
jgi:hypothetical protein